MILSFNQQIGLDCWGISKSDQQLHWTLKINICFPQIFFILCLISNHKTKHDIWFYAISRWVGKPMLLYFTDHWMVFRPSNLFENLHSLLVDYFCNKMSGIALRLAGAAATRPRAGMNWEYFSLFMFQQQRSCADLGLTNNFPPHNISVFSQRNIFDYRNRLGRLMWGVEVGGCWYQTWC